MSWLNKRSEQIITASEQALEEPGMLSNDKQSLLSTSDFIIMSRPATVRLNKQNAKKNFEDMFFDPLFPVMCNFPFVDFKLYLDIYSLFSVEQKHAYFPSRFVYDIEGYKKVTKWDCRR